MNFFEILQTNLHLLRLLQNLMTAVKIHCLLCGQSDGDLFTCEDSMLFSCAKISCSVL